jgi:hypothetical protein
MSALPGWDSVESTATIAHGLHVTAIVVLGLLFLSEGLALIYDFRKEHLASITERTRITAEQKKYDEAEKRHATELGGLKDQLNEAEKKVTDLEKVQPQRRLTEPQKDALFAAISPFPGQKVSINCIMGDIYGKEVAEDFVEVARKAKWDDGGGTGFSQSVYTQDPTGILVFINSVEADAHRAPIGVAALVQTLANLHLIPVAAVTGDANIPTGAVKIVIGKKP